MAYYLVIEYEDVEKINDYWIVGKSHSFIDKRIQLDPQITSSELCKKLKAKGYLHNIDLRKKLLVSDLDKDIIEIKQKSDKRPVCRLEKTV